MSEKRAADLGPGDVILRPNYRLPVLLVCRSGCYFPMNVKVTVLGEQEASVDSTGIQVVKFWSRREDTGAEGYVRYGPGAKVPMAAGEQS